MTARTIHRLLAAGACLLVAGGLSAADDPFAPLSSSPPRLNSAFTAYQPSPHFFPGRILRAKLADICEPPKAAVNTFAEPPPPANSTEARHDAPVAQSRDADQTSAPPFEERPTLET